MAEMAEPGEPRQGGSSDANADGTKLAASRRAAPHPMDVGTYETILRGRGFDASTVDDRRGRGLSIQQLITGKRKKQIETPWEVCLREDLSKNKAVWYNFWPWDLWCFARNTNPVAALFASHRKHPISRKERYYITILSFVFVMMISLCCAECNDCIACGITSCASNSDCVVSMDAPDNITVTYKEPKFGRGRYIERWKRMGHERPAPPPSNYCCACVRSGATWIISNINLDLGLFYISGTIFYQLIANIIFGQLHFQLAACGCCQRRDNKARKRWYMVAWATMACTLPALALPLPFFVAYAVYNDLLETTVTTFLWGQVQTKFLTSCFQTLVFSILWWRQRRSGNEGFHVTVEEFLRLRDGGAVVERDDQGDKAGHADDGAGQEATQSGPSAVDPVSAGQEVADDPEVLDRLGPSVRTVASSDTYKQPTSLGHAMHTFLSSVGA